MDGALHHWREPNHRCDELDRTLGNFIVTANVSGKFDMTGLPEPLVYVFYFSAHGDRIVQLTILRNRYDDV
jgi:hypothetical protein